MREFRLRTVTIRVRLPGSGDITNSTSNGRLFEKYGIMLDVERYDCDAGYKQIAWQDLALLCASSAFC
ncbi:hypothetical protein GCM10010520_12590 [Rhizobium viscosum]